MSMVKSVRELFLKQREIREVYRHVFETDEGRCILRHLMKTCHVSGPTFTAGDPHLTSFKEGQCHVVLSILRFLNKDDSELMKQIEEGQYED